MKTTYFATALLLIVSAACSADIRTWTDTQGRSMEAEFVRVDGDKVSFQKPDGMRYGFPLAQLSQADKDYIKSLNESDSNAGSGAAALEQSELAEWLEQNLVGVDGKKVARLRESHLPQAEYIAIYYSASWCPPCRKFTPVLVDFYNEKRAKHDNFELVYVSSDNTEEAQEKYMLDDKMPWPAVKFSKAKEKVAKQYAGSGIPCLVILDRQGNVLKHSYVDGKYVGPTVVMNELGKLLGK
ncbi:MAG: thioredoxin-like domain-containing protein [Opitutales bacterium]|jgi:nucleoredoxin|nr:thioredoxin-like domain-containing protein [Opitutales bacterium]MDP4644935.1 thioredoxin-like domain-containing protein [Opitutales bacterium]MDP4693545.1 thioredoxin-like domain-containing protein [Opitutales bacterium]MDP4776754.1 thioredoxin-like domain-containing protein [Opitutales bacterium]MDP4879011.1 thioredoxin-like domain-containing protein [Opitutales bacterium]